MNKRLFTIIFITLLLLSFLLSSAQHYSFHRRDDRPYLLARGRHVILRLHHYFTNHPNGDPLTLLTLDCLTKTISQYCPCRN
jgi:hypothetical protein